MTATQNAKEEEKEKEKKERKKRKVKSSSYFLLQPCIFEVWARKKSQKNISKHPRAFGEVSFQF